MILLNGHSLTPARKVPVEAESIQLKERESTATLTPADMTGIGVNSWLKDEGNPGDGIVWRVKSIGQAYATATPTVQLEHLISSLKDVILFGEHKPAQITGNKNATTCTAEQAVRYVLARQSDWTLGSFSYGSVTNPYKFDGDTLFDCLETISNSLTDAWWSYDFSRYPFRLNITQKSASVQSEMRAGRNLKAITKTIDKSGMYTRFYPIGANDLHIDSEYVERNVGTYGVISKVETDQSIDTKAELTRWANERLKQHAEPTVNIDVEGMELAAATGESMDKLTLGAVCRIPLPEFGTTIQERIVSLSYQDKVHQPEVVKVQLSNTRQDLTKILADAMKKGGRGGRANAKRDKEDMAWFEDTNDHVAMCAKGVVGVDAQGNPNWVRLTQLVVDGNGLDSTVSSVQNNVIVQQSQITQQEDSIGLVVKRQDNRPVSYYPKKSYFPSKGDPNRLYYAVDESRYYEWKNGTYALIANPRKLIDAGSIVMSINQAGESEAHIDADKVYIGNQKSTTVINGKCKLSDVTADVVQSRIAQLATLSTRYINANGNIYSSGSVTAAGGLYVQSSAGGGRVISVSNAIYQLQIVPVAGTTDTYVLQKKDLDDGDWVDVGTFDHATSTSLSGSWSSNTYTVTASPQGITNSVIPRVHIQTGITETVHINIGEMNSGSWTDHAGDEYAYLVRSGLTVYLKKNNSTGGSGNLTYGQITIPAATVSGTWSSNTWTATSTLGGSASISPQVHIATGTTETMTAKIGIMSGGSWTDHDGAAYGYLVKNGLTVMLRSQNATTGGATYAQITVDNPYPSTITMSQRTNASGNKQFTAYYLNGSTYVSMGSHYWYSSSKNLNVTSKTLHY